MSQSNKFATIFRILTLNFRFCASSIIAKASPLLAGEVDLLIVEFCMILHLYDLIFTMGKYKRKTEDNEHSGEKGRSCIRPITKHKP